MQRHYADVGKKRLLGFEAQVAIEEGLARTLAWFREQAIASQVAPFRDLQ